MDDFLNQVSKMREATLNRQTFTRRKKELQKSQPFSQYDFFYEAINMSVFVFSRYTLICVMQRLITCISV